MGDADAGTILFGRTRQRVLGLLLGHADESFYLREIVRQTGSAHGAVQRELAALTSAGVLRRSVRGRQVYFQANRDSSIFTDLLGLVQKTAGLVDLLRDALLRLSDDILVAFVFGSAARGQLRSDSDVDLMVIGETSFSEIVGALRPAQRRLGRDVNPTVYPPDEFQTKLRNGHHFLTSVLREQRLYVMGGDDELERLAESRMADRPRHISKGGKRPPRRRPARSRR